MPTPTVFDFSQENLQFSIWTRFIFSPLQLITSKTFIRREVYHVVLNLFLAKLAKILFLFVVTYHFGGLCYPSEQ
jgi:hypothetical protein